MRRHGRRVVPLQTVPKDTPDPILGEHRARALRLPPIFGLFALLVAAGVFSAGSIVYGDEMGPHIYAIIVGVFAEAALVLLVLDRIAHNEKQREWAFVRRTASCGE
jgi:hypothetical protein